MSTNSCGCGVIVVQPPITSGRQVVAAAKFSTAVPLPDLPQAMPGEGLDEFKPKLELFHREVLDYIRKTVNMAVTAAKAPDDPTTPGTTTVTVIVGQRYNKITHQFEVKKCNLTVTGSSTPTDWIPADGDQPVKVAKVVERVTYSTGTHLLAENVVADCYVLEVGAETLGEVINAAGPC